MVECREKAVSERNIFCFVRYFLCCGLQCHLARFTLTEIQSLDWSLYKKVFPEWFPIWERNVKPDQQPTMHCLFDFWQTFCYCVIHLHTQSLNPVVLVNTPRGCFWLLPTGNGFDLVVSWQALVWWFLWSRVQITWPEGVYWGGVGVEMFCHGLVHVGFHWVKVQWSDRNKPQLTCK